jgi:hypothetical protein
LLAATGDHDRRVGPGRALRQLRRIERPLKLEVLAAIGLIVAVFAAPHAQADLHRLLQHLEALRDWRIGHPQAVCLIGIVARADAKPGAATRQHIQRRYHLGQERWIPEVRRRRQGDQFDTPGAGREVGERRVAFRYLSLDWTHPGRNRPHVIGHGDAAEARFVSRLCDRCQRSA